MDLTNYLSLFLEEGHEAIQTLNDMLERLGQHPGDTESLQAAFRTAHTFKGMASTMGFQDMAEVAHALEGLLDGLRSGGLTLDAALLALILEAVAAIEPLLEAAERDRPADVALPPLLARLAEACAHLEPPAVGMPAEASSASPSLAEPPSAGGLKRTYHVEVVLAPMCLLKSIRAMMIVSSLETMGEVRDVTPAPEDLEWAQDACRFELWIETTAPLAAIEASFQDLSEIESVQVAEALPAALEIVVPAIPADVAPRRPSTVRVAPERLDSLLGLADQLVAEQGRLARLSDRPELDELVQRIGRLGAALQQELSELRLAPVELAFNRFPRMVRNLSHELGKDVELAMAGQAIMLDRQLVDELGEPLVHLLRNALDHGLETPDERLKAGKPACGTLRLAAFQEGAHVVIEVADDGRGLNPDQLIARAIAKGLLSPAQADRLGPSEALELIFLPGFSTAAAVTQLSGRGVGLDAVRETALALGGSLEVLTALGRGTTFRLRLPQAPEPSVPAPDPARR